MQEIIVSSKKRSELIDITAEVQKIVSASDRKNGACVVYSPHTTAGIVINENADPNVRKDIVAYLEKLIPKHAGFAHSEGNSDAHIKSALVGNNQTILVENGKLLLGTWEGIFFAEFDGPRKRKVLVTLID